MFDFQDVGLRLREFRPATDSDNLLALENDANIATWSSTSFPIPKGAAWKERQVKELETQTEMCCVVETLPSPSSNIPASDPTDKTKSDSEAAIKPTFVGIAVLWVNAERAHRHAKYTITLSPQFQNKGYGTKITQFIVDYGFRFVNLHRISVQIREGNGAAIAVCKKSGFFDEGKQRKARWQSGEWRDVILMGILSDEWKKGREEL